MRPRLGSFLFAASSLAGLWLLPVAPSFAQVADQKQPAAAKNPPAANVPPKVPAVQKAPAAAQPAAKAEAGAKAGPQSYRKLAPGVMIPVNPLTEASEMVSRHDVMELLADDPVYAERAWSKDKSPAKDTAFRRDVWALEFEFKPVRFIQVDVPQPEGHMERKLVWYLLYSVKNPQEKPVRFTPRFMLESRDTRKVYPDRLIPVALPEIQRREDPSRPLKNTIEMGTVMVPPTPKGRAATVWGVATWEDIDPATDYFAIYVQGLTNAYQWVDPPGAFTKGQPPTTGRQFYPKTLVLNFWRPSDRQHEHEDEIRFVDYSWAYGQLTPAGFVAKKGDSPPPAKAANAAAGGR